MSKDTFPDCLGWHAPDPVCDGDESSGEPPCTWRERCQYVQGLCRKVDKPEVATSIAKAQALGMLASEEAPTAPPRASAHGAVDPAPSLPPSTPKPESGVGMVYPPVLTSEGGLVRTAKTIHPRPSPRYDHVLPTVDVFVEKLAQELGTRVMQEGDPATRPGDLFVRWTTGMSGRAATLYEATATDTTRHFMITRIVMLVRKPRFNLKTGIRPERYAASLSLSPPTGVECVVWNDSAPCVALVGVDEHGAKEAARWLVRCYRNELIDQPKRAKSGKRKASK